MRNDIQGIPFMKKNGYKPVYSSADMVNNRTETPHDAISFVNGNFWVWKIGTSTSKGIIMQWQTARLIDGYYRYHHKVDTLEKAVEHQLKTDNEYE